MTRSTPICARISRQARSTIRLESYIFADDEAGEPILDLLASAAARGILVRLRIDAVGSWRMLSSARLAALRSAGVQLHWSRPWSWRRPLAYHRRNHRKLLVVDGASRLSGRLQHPSGQFGRRHRPRPVARHPPAVRV
ncbi:phospholipase D-like domain-containing protein [Rhodanobacter lindaniclasticus]